MNRFSTVCGWSAQRQGWRVKGRIWRVIKRDRLGLTPDLTTRDLWRSRIWAIEGKWENLSIHPCWTKVLLHAVKSYDMGPSRFTSYPRGRCAADLGFEPAIFGSSGQYTNHYTTKVTAFLCLRVKTNCVLACRELCLYLQNEQQECVYTKLATSELPMTLNKPSAYNQFDGIIFVFPDFIL
jgi:hypothetical protein